MESNIYDTDDWVRCARGGRLLQFFATDDELQNWFLTVLPETYRPYRLVQIFIRGSNDCPSGIPGVA